MLGHICVKRLVYYQNRIQRCRLYALSCFPVNCQVWHVYTCAETSLIVMECLQHCISEFNRNVNLNNRVPYKIFPMPSTSSPTNNCQGSNLELRFSCHGQGRHDQSITSVSSHWLPPDSPWLIGPCDSTNWKSWMLDWDGTCIITLGGKPSNWPDKFPRIISTPPPQVTWGAHQSSPQLAPNLNSTPFYAMGQPRVYGTLLDTPELEQVFVFLNNGVKCSNMFGKTIEKKM